MLPRRRECIFLVSNIKDSKFKYIIKILTSVLKFHIFGSDLKSSCYHNIRGGGKVPYLQAGHAKMTLQLEQLTPKPGIFIANA